MARTNIDESFIEVTELFKTVKDKHTADGLSSHLIPYITEHGISFVTDNGAVVLAKSKHSDFLQAERNAEKESEQRDTLFNAVMKDHRGCVQFLKKLYKVDLGRLGDWGVTVNNDHRIEYAPEFVDAHAEVIEFMDKHDSYAPGASPLEPFLVENSIVIATNRGKANDAKTHHDDFQQATADSENFREQRDNAINPVLDHLRGIASFLKGLYPLNPQKLGDWGYTIDESPQGSRLRTIIFGESEVRFVSDLLPESIMKNTGHTTLTIYPGKVNLGDDPANIPTPIVLNPGQTAIVKRGFGTVTISNGSNAEKGTAQFTVKNH